MHERLLSVSETKQHWRQVIYAGNEELATVREDRTDVWTTDGIEGGDKYESLFARLMETHIEQFTSFENWIKKRKLAGRSTHIIDLFGGGYFIDDYTYVDSMTGVRLLNIDRDLETNYIKRLKKDELVRLRRLREQKKRRVIPGNVFDLKTWKHFGVVDLMVISPHEGLNKTGQQVEESMSLYWQYFKHAYASLSQQDGHMLVHYPKLFMDQVEVLLARINRVPGIYMQLDEQKRSFKLLKTNNAPERLTLKLSQE